MTNLNTNNYFSSEKIWSVLCYLPFINIIFAVLASVKFVDNQGLRFHSRQGVVIFVLYFLSLIFVLINYGFGVMFFLILLIFSLIEIIAIFTDTFLILPGIGQIAQKIPEFFLYRLLTGKDPSESWISKE